MIVGPCKYRPGTDAVLESAGFSARRAALVLGDGDGVPPTQFAE